MHTPYLFMHQDCTFWPLWHVACCRYIVSQGPVALYLWWQGPLRDLSDDPTHMQRGLSIAMALYLIRFQFNTARKWHDRAADESRRHPKYHTKVKCMAAAYAHDFAGLFTVLWLANTA